MNLASLLLRTARTNPGRPALALGNSELFGYGELERRVGALAGQLRARFGLRAGDRVALFCHNCPQYVEILYAVWHASLVAVPINSKLHPKEVSYIVEDSAATLLFVTGELISHKGELAGAGNVRIIDVDSREYAALLTGDWLPIEARAPDDLAWMFYTSGTTGRPKGVMLSHNNLLAMMLCYFVDVDTAMAEDSILYAAPMSHGAGLYMLVHVLVGAVHACPCTGWRAPCRAGIRSVRPDGDS